MTQVINNAGVTPGISPLSTSMSPKKEEHERNWPGPVYLKEKKKVSQQGVQGSPAKLSVMNFQLII